MNLLEIIKVSRPIGWLIFPTVFYLGVRAAGGSLNLLILLIMLSLSFPFCFFGYGINDIYDYKSDRRNPRKKGVEGYLVKPKNRKFVKKLALILILPFIMLILLTLNLTSIFFAFFELFLGYFYSAPPIRLKERPPFDSISNGLIYFLLPYVLGFSIFKSILFLPIKVVWIGMSVAAIHAIGTMMDYDVEKKLGIKTFAVAFGLRKTALFAFLIFLIAFLFNRFGVVFQCYYIFLIFLSFFLLLFPTPKHASIVFKIIFLGFFISVFFYFLIK
jgi:4-hydroxybenzoate polyprenyltransferase